MWQLCPPAGNYDQGDIPKDKAMASMTTKIDVIAAQMAELLPFFANPFFSHQYRTKSTANSRWEFKLRIDLPEFQGSG